MSTRERITASDVLFALVKTTSIGAACGLAAGGLIVIAALVGQSNEAARAAREAAPSFRWTDKNRWE